jgi:hypothetical protein
VKLLRIKSIGFFLLLFSVCVKGDSIITESSPWGVVAVWEGTDYSSVYKQKLDSAYACGLSWIRPNCIPHREDLQRRDGIFREDKLAEIDSFVKFVQDRDMDILYVGWPPNHYSSVEDTIGYYEFFRALVERYDNDGEGYTTIWGQYIEEPQWLTKPIKYWEICNEPQFWGFPTTNSGKSWPDYGDRTPADFRIYIRNASRGVHAAYKDAKVLGPCITPLHSFWKIRGGRTLKMPPDSLWWWMIGDGMKDFFDVISVHEYSGSVASCFEKLDSMRIILEDLGAGDIPVWITEKGWHRTVRNPSRSIRYRDYSQGMLDRGWLEKTFFFVLKNYPPGEKILNKSTLKKLKAAARDFKLPGKGDPHSLLKKNGEHTPAYDTLKSFIKRNAP